MNINPFEILELKPYELNKIDIKKAYLKKVREYPPEHNSDKFKKIRNAYEILINATAPYEKFSIAPLEMEKIKNTKEELQEYLEKELILLDKKNQIKKSFILNLINKEKV